MPVKNIREIQNQLKAVGHEDYSLLLEPYAERTRELRRIAFAGEQLSGKSSVINALLGREILPVGVEPVTCRLLITPAENDALILPDGTREEISAAENICADHKELTVEADIPFLKENQVEFVEFPDVLEKKFNELIDLYCCDCVVLIMNAEKFLNLQEQAFIDSYIKFIGPERIILVINKLSLVSGQNRQRVIDYVKSKAASKIPGIRFIFTDVKYSGTSWEDYARKKILAMISTTVPLPVSKMTEAVASMLSDELKQIRAEAQRNNELAVRENGDAIILNNSLTEFGKRENLAVQVLTDKMKSEFEALARDAVDQFHKNGREWYLGTFKGYSAERVKKIFAQCIKESAERLNEDTVRLSIGLSGDTLYPAEISAPANLKDIAVIEGGKDWYKYRQFVFYGVSILAVIISGVIGHYNILNGIITGLVVICAGAGGDFVMRTKNKMFTSDMERSIKLTAEKLSSEAVDVLSAEVRKAYHATEAKFRNAADSVIGGSIFAPVDENSETAKKIRALEGLISQLKGEE